MAQVHGDPDEVRAFARKLHEFGQETREHIKRLSSALEHLEYNSWGDATHRRYQEMFDTLVERFETLLDGIENEHEPHLNGVAQRLEDVLSQ